MEKRDLLYEGKAKKVYKTDDPSLYIIEYKDDATAFNALKRGTIAGKGIVNNKMTCIIFRYAQKNRHPDAISSTDGRQPSAVKSVEIVPLEVNPQMRNVAAGSMSKNLGIEEGTPLKQTRFVFC
jgi:phosphoribosylaminoimidazole-succinocarboxamide synthase